MMKWIDYVFSGLAVKQSLFSARLMYAFVIIMYPLVGIIYGEVLADVHDPLWLRGIFASLILAVFILSFMSTMVENCISNISLVFYYLLTFHNLYITSVNDYIAEFTIGLVIVLMAGGIILNNIRSLILYAMVVLVWVSLSVNLTPHNFNNLDPTVAVTVIFTSLTVTAIFILVRIDLSKKLLFSDMIVKSVNASILVFDEENELIFNKTPDKNLKSIVCSLIRHKPISHLRSEDQFTVRNDRTWLKWNVSDTTNGMKILIGQDITDLKEKEEELVDMTATIQKYADRIDSLHKLDKSFMTSETFEGSLELVLKFVHSLLPNANEIALVNLYKNEAIVNAVLREGVEIDFVNTKLSLENFSEIIELDDGILYTPNLNEKKNPTLIEERLRKEGLVSRVVFPIFDGTTTFACINLGFSSLTILSDEELQNLKEIVQELGVFIRQIELKKEIYTKNLILSEKNNQLQKVNEELSHFAYMTSHDLKAPLRAVNSLSLFIYEDYAESLPKEGKEQLFLLRKQVGRMDALINGILKFSKVGSHVENYQEVNVKSMIGSILESLAPPEEIQIDIGDLPIINGDPIRLEQVFQNLITNAIKFNDKVEGFINIDCERMESDFQFSVKDCGAGIDSEFFEKIFVLFHTVEKKEQEDSTGIGLAIAKKSVELMGGKIWVESKLGEGSNFYFTIPLSNEVTKNKEVLIYNG